MKGNVVINNAYSGCVKIGFADISLFDKKYERCIWDNTGEIVFNRTASIGHGSRIFNEGDLELGDNFTITANTGVVCCKRISFGNNCLISWDCLIMDTDFHKIIDINGNRINDNKDIVIGDNVWIGCRNLILKGTVINNDTVIAAGSSLVNHVFDDSNIIIGKRNEILKKGITWRQ
ncbi:MAG TPA: hypothetical protein DHW61_12780 [Lachnoclostridium phytofermentans]|uniref:Acyltransferase n=2 Tax=Lachnoclostridium TaxID=1506553 RepID=A0A3D2X827_9FIRM|nr:hypothetical protein [Lachnoclostridium phytofermentans]